VISASTAKLRFVGCIAGLALTQAGCFVAERHIDARVRDLGAVSLHVDPGEGQSTRVILAGDGQPASAMVATGTFPTGGSSSAALELDADRLPDRTIRLRWVHPPIVGGEIETLLPPSGRIRLSGTADVASTLALDAPNLRIPLVASLYSSTDTDGSFVGYGAAVSPPSQVPGGASVAVSTTLETPWSNVVEIRRRVKPLRGLMLGILILNSVFWGAFGGAYIAAAPGFGAGSSGETAFRCVGWGSLAVGGLVDLFLLPTILGPGTNEVVYPRP
jgi:hypothetical protein